MSDEKMSAFPNDLGTIGYAVNITTCGGHQIDVVAAEEFSTALKEGGMLAFARLQRKIRLVNSLYCTLQTLAGWRTKGSDIH